MSVTAEKVTTMAALKQPPAVAEPQAIVTMGFASSQSFELMQRAAKLLASSSLVPKEYQGNIANCTIALNMAQRMGADPLMVMQHLYLVHGRPGWSAQFLIASFNQCGRFNAIRYKWGGTEGKDDWSCQAYALERQTGETITGPTISIALSKKEGWYAKSGSKWQSIPQLMLMYRAAAWLVRTHAPEISMGLQTQEEIHDVYDARNQGGRFEVDLDSLRGPADVNTKPEPETGDYVPHYSDETALKAIKEAADPAVLEKARADVWLDYQQSNRLVPPDIEDAYKAQKELLTKL